MKWVTPARAGGSSRDPAPIQNPIAAERTPAIRSVITRTPEPSSVTSYSCIREIVVSRARSSPPEERAGAGVGAASVAQCEDAVALQLGVVLAASLPLAKEHVDTDGERCHAHAG